MKAHRLLLAFVTSLTCAESAVNGGLSVAREGDLLTIECQAPATVGALSLFIHSDRNASVPRFSDVSPLQPSAWPDGRQRGRELWWPVIDFVVDDTMEAVVKLADIPAGVQVSWNGWVRRESEPAQAMLRFAAARVLQWENPLWVDRAGPQLTRFCVRRPLTASAINLRLLAPDWSGRIEVVARDASGRESILHSRRVEAAPPPLPSPPSGTHLEAPRLRAALAEVVEHTLRSRVQDPRDPMHGGLYLFYDLDARTYRTSHWIWGWGPSVGLLHETCRMSEVAAQFGSDRLLAAAKDIGEVSLRTVSRDPASPVRGIPVSRWDRAPQMDFGHELSVTPCDAGFLAEWTWVRLGETTGDPKWRRACDELVAALDRLMTKFPIPPARPRRTRRSLAAFGRGHSTMVSREFNLRRGLLRAGVVGGTARAASRSLAALIPASARNRFPAGSSRRLAARG